MSRVLQLKTTDDVHEMLTVGSLVYVEYPESWNSAVWKNGFYLLTKRNGYDFNVLNEVDNYLFFHVLHDVLRDRGRIFLLG